jgi:dihydroxyacetone kinase-like predicted kinase
VTWAVREALTSAGFCRPVDVLGLMDDDVVCIGADVAEVGRAVLERMLTAGGELVTLLAGQEAADTLAPSLEQFVRHSRPDVEVVVHHGGQRSFPVLLGVE